MRRWRGTIEAQLPTGPGLAAAALLAHSRLDLPSLAYNGHDGAGIGVHTPVKQPAGYQVLDTRTRNALLRGPR